MCLSLAAGYFDEGGWGSVFITYFADGGWGSGGTTWEAKGVSMLSSASS